MKTINIIFGTHNNQPIGNFDSIIEDVYQRAYKPFLSIINKYPDFKVALHYSGYLLRWLEDNHPEFQMLLEEMVKSKQVELLGGGFYEPVLSMIPNRDKIGQIEHLTTFLRQRFGKRPRGFWITERVWEPSHAFIINTSGMQYVFLDDIHIKSGGVEDSELFYPYLTEDQGKTISIYPLSKSLRYIIPYREPEDVIHFLKNSATEEGDRVLTIIDDGEKYGEWKGSYERCYQQGWMKRFIELVLENGDCIKTVHPGKYLSDRGPRGKIYFPSMLYDEMMDWVLLPSRTKKLSELKRKIAVKSGDDGFLPGGTFKGFLYKYPESSLMYSKMMYVNILVNQMGGDRSRKKAAREEMWKGQCNHAYWHGSSGGIYFNHLRKGIYRSLIDAEKLTRDKSVFLPSIFAVDFDMDGHDEFIYQGTIYNGYVHEKGGMLFELDHLDASWNYCDTLSRYVEFYHSYIERDNGYDWYIRKAFIDHFFLSRIDAGSFAKMKFTECGDFVDKPYDLVSIDRDKYGLGLKRDGNVSIGENKHDVRVSKTFAFSKTDFTVGYILSQKSGTPFEFVFGVEINLALASNNPVDSDVIVCSGGSDITLGNTQFEIDDCSHFIVKDIQNKVSITISASKPFSLISTITETYSQSIDALERIYQGTSFLICCPVSLAPDANWENDISVKFTSLARK
jgi:4-alpha-glucanotransferase